MGLHPIPLCLSLPFSRFLSFKTYIFNCVYVGLCEYIVYSCPWKPEEGVRASVIGVNSWTRALGTELRSSANTVHPLQLPLTRLLFILLPLSSLATLLLKFWNFKAFSKTRLLSDPHRYNLRPHAASPAGNLHLNTTQGDQSHVSLGSYAAWIFQCSQGEAPSVVPD